MTARSSQVGTMTPDISSLEASEGDPACSLGGPPAVESLRAAFKCQAPSCGRILQAGDPKYYKKFKVCRYHSSAQELVFEGRSGPVRFCQQCGKFQDLEEFDGDRKSCRDSLAKHNARRRHSRKVAREATRPAATDAAAPPPEAAAAAAECPAKGRSSFVLSSTGAHPLSAVFASGRPLSPPMLPKADSMELSPPYLAHVFLSSGTRSLEGWPLGPGAFPPGTDAGAAAAPPASALAHASYSPFQQGHSMCALPFSPNSTGDHHVPFCQEQLPGQGQTQALGQQQAAGALQCGLPINSGPPFGALTAPAQQPWPELFSEVLPGTQQSPAGVGTGGGHPAAMQLPWPSSAAKLEQQGPTAGPGAVLPMAPLAGLMQELTAMEPCQLAPAQAMPSQASCDAQGSAAIGAPASFLVPPATDPGAAQQQQVQRSQGANTSGLCLPWALAASRTEQRASEADLERVSYHLFKVPPTMLAPHVLEGVMLLLRQGIDLTVVD